MRFISMHSSNASMEAGEPPSAEVMAGMGPLMGEMIQAGVLVAGEGLRPTSHGVRLSFSNGKRTITKGPFVGSNELIDRYLIVRVHSIDEAIEWATRFASGVGDSEIDVRPVTEAWDIGLMPRPAGETTTRYMILHKSDARSEAGRPAPVSLSALDANVLLSTEALQPSAKGVRLKFSGGQRRIIDGPFTESKELIAGFSIMNAQSMDEVIEWASRFAALIGDVQIEIRPLYEPSDLR